MKLRLLATAASLALATTAGLARAQDHPPLPPDVVAKVAAALCMKDGRAIGKDAFLAKYGSLAACVEQKTPDAQAIVDACRTAPQPVQCILGRVGLPPSGDSQPTAGQGVVRAVAARLCIAEFRKLGEVAFKAKYASTQACVSQHEAQAHAILESCRTAPDPKGCVAEAVGMPARPEGATPHK
jgi:hypothetical protein